MPVQFEQPDIQVMRELIRNRPLATLVTPPSEAWFATHPSGAGFPRRSNQARFNPRFRFLKSSRGVPRSIYEYRNDLKHSNGQSIPVCLDSEVGRDEPFTELNNNNR